MEFKEIKNQDDIDFLMSQYVGFHDSCIKEIKYISGSFVAEDGSMNPINNVREIEVIFQSQISKKRTLQICFEKLKMIYLEPEDESFDCVIYGASIKQFNGLFYWCNWENLKSEEIDKRKGTLISAKKVKWRFL